ncbi:protein kinase C-binding protein NELL1-like isoform X1 [Pristis pectinata]|uniref:protein kinase C-binding protein NELL1-like isoform X1 n=2 Tax=Pristis pectinata TaxID=685728 RepID=UPI00223DDBE9|nr:protein kinase C-binding protein NELL1-like isoform X1 [Pristis pectinata]
MLQMDIIAVILAFILCAKSVLGFGMDPDLQIDVTTEMDLDNTTTGVAQVPGLYNNSKAYLFQDVERQIEAAPHMTEKMIQLLRNKSEFTVVATIQQKVLTSGVILSIHESDLRYFELESSGQRDEIRYHYCFNGKPRTEVFPYRLADGQWHRIALSISASHLLLHVDCHRIYERVIDPPQTTLSPGISVWLGQRNSRHGLFKGILQDVKIILMPNGYITQCPNLNRTCPTCSDFLNLVQGIMDLQELLAKMTTKLNYAEARLNELESCYCEKTCQVNRDVHRSMESWVEKCKNCTCKNGAIECRRVSCPPLNCPADFRPVYRPGKCCKECRPICLYGGQKLAEGQRALKSKCRECRNRTMVIVHETCPPLDCPLNEHIQPENRCCNVCRGHDFCAEGHQCGENSECWNLNTKAICMCKNGFVPIQGDTANCEDKDECANGTHYCHANTVCVNVPGSYHCDCLPGYTRVDDYSCTKHDECGSRQHTCDETAICTNTVGGHLCTCKPGYVGNGTICRAFCEEGCRNGGSCVTPEVCACPPGFTGRSCQTDIDECAEGIIQCHRHARCVNLPGWYHCECRTGYHDNGNYSFTGETCIDIDECATGMHSCWNDSVCVNLEGGFDCRCPFGEHCTGDCPHDEELKRNGQVWTLRNDRCSVCSCQDGKIFCRRTVCDCRNPNVDLFCCSECDTRVTSQCLHQNGHLVYRSGDIWTYSCQQCRCLQGEVDCWPLTCPALSCQYTTIPDGECCPHCVSDPCLADNMVYDIRQTCIDNHGITRLSGSIWTMAGSPCTTCKCKNGNICCSVDVECLYNN